MKKTIALSAIFAVSASVASAATTVGLNNFSFPATPENGITIVDNLGNPISAAAFGIGTLSTPLSGSSGPADVRASFTELGAGSTSSVHFSASQTTASTDASPQDDSPVYVVFYGNAADGTAAADLASATEFIVFEGDSNFITEDAVLGASFSVNLQDSTVVYGTSQDSNNSGVNPPFTAFTNGVTFGNVPEPSSALLSVLGLAFVARRRR